MDENLWTGLGGIVVACSIIVTLQVASAVDGSPAATPADDPVSQADTVAAGVESSAILMASERIMPYRTWEIIPRFANKDPVTSTKSQWLSQTQTEEEADEIVLPVAPKGLDPSTTRLREEVAARADMLSPDRLKNSATEPPGPAVVTKPSPDPSAPAMREQRAARSGEDEQRLTRGGIAGGAKTREVKRHPAVQQTKKEKKAKSLTGSAIPAEPGPPTSSLPAKSYAASVWSGLARQKLNSNRRGSTTLSFAIGATGRLRSVRVVRSSGNAEVDRAAIATVRRAAPFPKPPASNAVYTIQIGTR